MKNIIVGLMLAAVLLPGLANAKKALVDKHGVNLLDADKVYTSVNLHPDNVKGVLYTVNYQLPALLPRCTEVDISKLGKKKMVFRVKESNREYTYIYHKKSTPIPLNEYLADFFSSECGESDLAGLNAKDKEGVMVGRPLVGMTKAGVLMAMGRPPYHVNPSLDYYEWTYWKNRFARKVITFGKDGKVSQIR